MNITITGSLGNISKPLALQLIEAGHKVTIISSTEDKRSTIEALGATAAIGAVEDITFLTKSFTDAEVIYTMVPPSFSASNYRAYIARIGQNYAKAIQDSGVKKVVNLSSIGAHLNGGTGPIAGLHDVEQLFNALANVTVKHLRPAYFYINFLGNIDMIKHLDILGSNFPGNTPQVLVHPNDIAVVAAHEIQTTFYNNSITYIASDEVTADEIAVTLGNAVGKPALQWIEFTDEQAFNGMLQAGLSAEIARNYVEMGTAIRSKILFEDYNQHKPTLGKVKLKDFAEEFKQIYQS